MIEKQALTYGTIIFRHIIQYIYYGITIKTFNKSWYLVPGN